MSELLGLLVAELIELVFGNLLARYWLATVLFLLSAASGAAAWWLWPAAWGWFFALEAGVLVVLAGRAAWREVRRNPMD